MRTRQYDKRAMKCTGYHDNGDGVIDDDDDHHNSPQDAGIFKCSEPTQEGGESSEEVRLHEGERSDEAVPQAARKVGRREGGKGEPAEAAEGGPGVIHDKADPLTAADCLCRRCTE